MQTTYKGGKREIKNYYHSFGFKNISTDWHRYFKHLNGNFYKEYIPEDFFYNVIEPSLNMSIMFPALTDKNILDKLFIGVKQPKSIVKNINGIYLNASSNVILTFDEAVGLCNKYQKLVIKPTIESGGGKNVGILNINKGLTDQKNLSINQVLKNYEKNFIIQEYLNQHPQMKLLNESSVNTLRIETLLIDNKIVVLNSILRIGMKGLRIDNMSQGGYVFKIKQDGKLYNRGYFETGLEIEKKDLDFDIEEFKVPNYQIILKVVQDLHKQILHFKMISWDMAIDETCDPVLIEYNVLWGKVFFKNIMHFLVSTPMKF